MALDYRNYRLNTNRGNMDWLNQNMPQSPMARPTLQPTATAASAGGGSSMLAADPMMAIGQGALETIGAGVNAYAENKRYQEEKKYREKQDKQAQKNLERQMGMGTLSFLKDDYATALARSMRGY